MLSDLSLDEYEKKKDSAKRAYDERSKWILENIKDEKERADSLIRNEIWLSAQIAIIEDQRRKDAEKRREEFTKDSLKKRDVPESEVFDNTTYGDDWSLIGRMVNGRFGLTQEEESALRQGFRVLEDYSRQYIDFLQEQADEQARIAEDRVRTLESELDEEKRLMEEGFANNYDLKKKELARAKQLNDVAIAEQKRVQRITEILSEIEMAINLTVAISEIIKKTFKTLDPVSATLISAGLSGALLVGFEAYKSQAKSKAQFGEGGEIRGPSHEGGGVAIEAEGGEYVVKASQYAKHRELVQAINEGNISNQFFEMNRADSVTLDDRKYEGMMKKYFGARNVTHIPNGRVEKWGNRTRTIHYA
jgi:hypothetical protein